MEQYIRNIMTTAAEKAKEEQRNPSEPTGRRESLLFSGFPAQEDRPSLPVTPAPIMTAPFWADDEARTDEGGTGATESLPEQAEWVCPQCGFVSNDPAVFTAPRSLASSGAAISARPAESPTVLKSPEALQAKDIKLSPPRPVVPQRESSSEISAISGASTAVPADPNPTPAARPPPSPPKVPVPVELLPPPAWLTAAVVEYEDVTQEEQSSEPPADPTSLPASSQELTAC
jgi:glycogenin